MSFFVLDNIKCRSYKPDIKESANKTLKKQWMISVIVFRCQIIGMFLWVSHSRGTLRKGILTMQLQRLREELENAIEGNSKVLEESVFDLLQSTVTWLRKSRIEMHFISNIV